VTVDRSVTIRLRVSSAEFDAAMAQAGASVRVLRGEVESAGRSAGGPGAGGLDQLSQAAQRAASDTDKLAAASKNANAPTLSLWGSLAALAPATVPLAGGLLGLSSGLAGVAAAGAFAFKGLTADVAAANVTTDQYQNTLGVLQGQLNVNANAGMVFAASTAQMKRDLTQLESTAGSGVLSGFSAGMDKVQAQEPSFNSFIAKASTGLGDLASHGLGTLVSLLTAAEPLILTAETDLSKMAGSLESWASGPGGTRFFQELGNDIPLVISLLGNLAVTTGHVVAAAEPIGTVVLSTINDLSHVLNLIPVPVLAAVAAGFVSWKVAQIAGIAVDAATSAAIKGAASAQLLSRAQLEAATTAGFLTEAETKAALATEAAGAGGAAASSRLIGVAGALGKVIPLYIGATLAVGALHNATNSLNDSTSTSGQIVGESVTNLNDLLHGNVTGMFSDTSKNVAASQARQAAQDDVNAYYTEAAKQTVVSKAIYDAAFPNRVLGDKYSSANFTALGLGTGNLNSQVDHAGQISQTAAGFDQITAGIQKNIDAESKWQDATGKTITLANGVKVSMGNYSLALQQANGNVAGAINIIHGHAVALADDNTALAAAQEAQKNVNQYVSDMQTKYGMTTDQVNLFTTAMGISAKTVEQGGTALQTAETEFAGFFTEIQNGSTSVTNWISAISAYNNSAQTAADTGNLLGAAMVAFNGPALQYGLTMSEAAKANEKFVIDANGTNKTFKETLAGVISLKDGTIDYHNAGSSVLLQDLSDLQSASMKAAAATFQYETSQHNANAELDASNVYFNDTHQALVDQAAQLGITGPQAAKLADTYFKWPKDATTQLKLLGDGYVNQALAGILDDLDILAHKKVAPTVGITDNATPQIRGLQTLLGNLGGGVTVPVTTVMSNPLNLPGIPNVPNTNQPPPKKKAGGGKITDGTTSTADDVLILASKGEYMVNAMAYAKHPALVEAINNGVQGFESGGFVGAGVPPKTVSANAGKAAANKATAQGQLLITIGTVDASKFLASIPGTAAAIQSAETTLANAVTKAGGGSALAHTLSGENSALIEMAQDRAELANQLKTANTALAKVQTQWITEVQTVAAATTGAFDITKAGQSSWGVSSLNGILNDITLQNQHAQLFASQLNTISKLGLNSTSFAQLAKGGYANSEYSAAALAGASKAQIAQLNAGVKQIDATGLQVGYAAANGLYGAGLHAAEGLVAGLKSQEAALTKQMQHLADIMVNQIRKDLGIKSPSVVMRAIGGHLGTGLIQGLGDQEQAVAHAGAKLTAAAINYRTARPVSSSGGGSGVVQLAPEDRQLLTKAIDAWGSGLKVSGQLTARGRDLEANLMAAQSGRRA
jgi:hypothetical protein